MEKEFKELVKRLRAESGCSLLSSKKALEAHGSDYTRALQYLLNGLKEGTIQAYERPARRCGLVGADVTMEGNYGVIISISCDTEASCNSNVFGNLLDILLFIGLDNSTRDMRTVSEFLGAEVPEDVQQIFKDSYIANCYTVEDLLKTVSSMIRETVMLEHFEPVVADLGGGQYIRLHSYTHHNNSMAGIVSLIKFAGNEADTSNIAQKITSVAVCYNPLVTSEESLDASVKEHFMKYADISRDKNKQWQEFLDEVVLNRIKIPVAPAQELNAMAVEEQEKSHETEMETIEEICRRNKLTIIDFFRFKFKDTTEI